MQPFFAQRFEKVEPSFIREILKVAANPEIISFAGGLPNPHLFPVKAIEQACQDVLREQGAAALHDTILNSAKQCCAIEGSYPKSLKHLEEDYGLTINHNDYIVSYEYFAGNIMPSVVVTPR